MKIGLLVRLQNTVDFFERAKRDDYARPPSYSDYRVVLDQMRQAALADDLGYDAVWVLEEHFSASAMAGQPWVLAAALAARTRFCDLGVILSLSALKDPLATGEALSLVDNLLSTRGMHLVLGQAPAPHECVAAGVPQSSMVSRLRESVQVLESMFADEWFDHHGTHWDIPSTTVRPVLQRPDLMERLVFSAGCVDADPGLASYASGLFHSSMGDMAQTMRLDAEVRRVRGEAARPYAGCAIHVPVFCSESRREAETAREWWAQAFDAEVWHYGLRHHPATRRAAADLKGRAMTAEINRAYEIAKGSGVFGTPDECVALIRQMQESIPMTHLIAQMQFGLMPPDAAERSIRRFAEEVLPLLRQDSDEPSKD